MIGRIRGALADFVSPSFAYSALRLTLDAGREMDAATRKQRERAS